MEVGTKVHSRHLGDGTITSVSHYPSDGTIESVMVSFPGQEWDWLFCADSWGCFSARDGFDIHTLREEHYV